MVNAARPPVIERRSMSSSARLSALRHRRLHALPAGAGRLDAPGCLARLALGSPMMSPVWDSGDDDVDLDDPARAGRRPPRPPPP